jgi:hypothetical protein
VLDRGRDTRDELALELLAQMTLLLGVGDPVTHDLVAALAELGGETMLESS